MNQGQGPWKGKSEDKPGKPASLKEAFEDAWNNAKNNGAAPDVPLTVEAIQIVGNNPIHTYIVIVGGS